MNKKILVRTKMFSKEGLSQEGEYNHFKCKCSPSFKAIYLSSTERSPEDNGYSDELDMGIYFKDEQHLLDLGIEIINTYLNKVDITAHQKHQIIQNILKTEKDE